MVQGFNSIILITLAPNICHIYLAMLLRGMNFQQALGRRLSNTED
jgi:hypothetical protein